MESTKCLCGENKTKLLYSLKKDKNTFKIVSCKNCGLVFMNPRPKTRELEKFYAKNYYYDDNFFDSKNYLKALNLFSEIKKNLKKGSLLDIGCSKGFLLFFAKKSGFKPYGVEPSKDAINYAKKNYNIKIDYGYFDSFKTKNESYDNITAIDFIEHVRDPRFTLKKIYKMMKKDGVLIIETPNIASLYSRISGRRWMGFDLPFHLYYFTPKTLKRIMEEVGFKNIKMETSHFNLLSREGFFRSKGYGSYLLARKLLKILGKDPDKVSENIDKKNYEKKKNQEVKLDINHNMLDKFEIELNKPFNYVFATKLLMGDAVRVIAKK